MKLDKNKILNIIFLVLVILLSIFGVNQYITNVKNKEILSSYKEKIIKSDSLIKREEGHYQKVVNDLNSTKDLLNVIKKENKDLYKSIKKDDKNPIFYSNIGLKPITKIDSVFIHDTIREGIKYKYFEDFYPSKTDYFVKYSGQLDSTKVIGKWDFNTLNIDLVISEKEKGIFYADLKSPEWIKVNKLNVNSLPLENIKIDNFDWLMGGNVGINFLDKTPVAGFEAGFRFKKNIFKTEINTNKEIKIGYNKLF